MCQNFGVLFKFFNQFQYNYFDAGNTDANNFNNSLIH